MEEPLAARPIPWGSKPVNDLGRNEHRKVVVGGKPHVHGAMRMMTMSAKEERDLSCSS